jgi:hypothetical protein
VIDPKDISTIDNRIYRDVPGGKAVIVQDRDERGIYRAIFNRMENKIRRTPTAEEKAAFEKCERTLFLADYEIEFRIVLCGLSEQETAELVGVNNW